jgi:predicted permease
MITVIMLIICVIASFSIQKEYCELVSITPYSWTCHYEPITEMLVVYLNFAFLAISLLYLITEAMGWIPVGNKQNEE